MMIRTASHQLAAAVALVVLVLAAGPAPARDSAAAAFSGPFSSAADDPLALPGEVYVISAADLVRFGIHTLEDLVEHLPGVSMWQEGPPGARAAFSVDGRTWKGITLLVNGVPHNDPYTQDPLARFLTLSRLRRVEVIYSASPCLTGRAAAASVINIVIEEGGRKPPFTAGDFTWGRSGRASRKVWFSTPDAFITGTLAYDEYMHDFFEALPEIPSAFIGDYGSRAVLLDLALRGESDQRVLLRVRRYQDAYTGTPFRPELRQTFFLPEEVRYSGFDSEIRYLRGSSGVSIRQRLVEMTRSAGRTSGLVVSGSGYWRGAAGPATLKCFVNAERTAFENRLWGTRFDPQHDLFEAGLAAGMPAGAGLRWRLGLSGGWLSEAGPFTGGEAALARGPADGLYQSLTLARRMRTPTAEELFQPPLERLADGTTLATAGSVDLGCERSDEVTVSLGFARRASVDLFARRERARIVLEGDSPAVYSSSGADDVAGIRARFSGDGATGLFGIRYGWVLSGFWYGDRAALTEGIPAYGARCGLWLSRRSFKKTENFILRLDAFEAGERDFGAARLEPYSVIDLSASITVIGAVVKFQIKNILDERYETRPGTLMPERNYRFGINWHLFD